MWLKEGPAEYSSHLFVEWKDGEEAFIDVVKDNQLFVLEECHIQDNGFHPHAHARRGNLRAPHLLQRRIHCAQPASLPRR